MSVTLLNFLCFLGGIAAAYGWGYVKSLVLHRAYEPPRLGRRSGTMLAAVIVLAGSLLVGLQSENTHNEVARLSSETQRCYREFAAALNARSQLSLSNDALSRQQRDALAKTQVALYEYIEMLLSPPAEIAALPPTDQRRRDYGLIITAEFNRQLRESNQVISEASEQQRRNDEERAKTPLPEPTCGQ